MAQHGRTVKQSYCETVYVMILFDYSSRVPIPHWLCFLHVHWCRDCETVFEQHWNKPGTVSQSQCTPPQCKQIIFGIKNGSEVQSQSSSELTGFLTVLKCICGPNLEILSWTGDEISHGQTQNGVNFALQVKFDLDGQGQSTPKYSLHGVKLYISGEIQLILRVLQLRLAEQLKHNETTLTILFKYCLQ